jgi:hypothetical protein
MVHVQKTGDLCSTTEGHVAELALAEHGRQNTEGVNL